MLTIPLIDPLYELHSMVMAGSRVRYLDDDGTIREAHLRGYRVEPGAALETAQVRLSSDIHVYELPLIVLVRLKYHGQLGLAR